ncbi:Ubiquitin-conjugating enzyme E2 6 [Boothiomyces sp. JEL0838]|nr:Ubiquitin-conjugating enzyme E2 6 [Boothiomyces sp. JEL0838]
MASKQAHKRLTKEYLLITKNPPPYIIAKPLESDILEWHYIITGPKDTPYEGGEFHGKVIFPADYPFKPPAIKMLTPNGRFRTDFRLCLSMSDYHPGSWNPAWSVATILTGLLSFMLEDTETTGSIKTSDEDKRIFAKQSKAWNRKQERFRAIFPDLADIEVENPPAETVLTLRKKPIPQPKKEPEQNVVKSVNYKLWFSVFFSGIFVYLVLLKLSTRL